MWNYNLDQMPKDGTEIVVLAKTYTGNIYANITPITKRDIERAVCWTYAPKDPIALLIDWFDHAYPNVSKESGVQYQDGLEIILNLINCVCLPAQDKGLKKVLDWFVVELGQTEIKNNLPEKVFLKVIKERIEFKMAQNGRKEPEVAVSDEKVAEKVCPTCARHNDGYGAVCLICGRGLGG